LLMDPYGAVPESISYNSFGNGSSSLTRYGYTGRESDEQTGLYYYRARWYDASIGRFISEDPVGFGGGDVNLYAYVKNNPLNLIDPEGTQFRADRDRPGDQYPGMKKPYQPDRSGGAACALDGFNPWLSLEAGGGFHAFIFGGSISFGVMVNPLTLEVCVYRKICVRTGFGIYVGGGPKFGGTVLGPSRAKDTSPISNELAGDLSTPETGGASGSIGFGGGGVGIGPNYGAGASVGVDTCYTTIISCINSPNCPCNK
jgi:RHS repeat-associated protein